MAQVKVNDGHFDEDSYFAEPKLNICVVEVLFLEDDQIYVVINKFKE